jgi:uncharacterized protein YjbI with pentapeptide repeats
MTSSRAAGAARSAVQDAPGSMFDNAQWAGRDLQGSNLEGASLRGANLSGADLRGANLSRADLSGADLRGASVSDARFEWANLSNVNGVDAQLDGVTLRGATLSHANLRNASFEGADLSLAKAEGTALFRATFRRANLEGARLTDCLLRHTDFTEAKLNDASLARSELDSAVFEKAQARSTTFSGCQLQGANFKSADVNGAHFDNADLREVKDILFDSNSSRGARFGYRPSDPWSELRGAYTGPRLVYNIMLTMLALLPYAAQAAMWWAVNMMQSRANLVDDAGVAICLAEACTEWRVLELVLGFHRGFFVSLLTLLLITYSVMRGLLTLRVAPLREDEERSGVLPAKADYLPLQRMHYVVRALFVVALLSVLYHLGSWLWQPVMLPSS